MTSNGFLQEGQWSKQQKLRKCIGAKRRKAKRKWKIKKEKMEKLIRETQRKHDSRQTFWELEVLPKNTSNLWFLMDNIPKTPKNTKSCLRTNPNPKAIMISLLLIRETLNPAYSTVKKIFVLKQVIKYFSTRANSIRRSPMKVLLEKFFFFLFAWKKGKKHDDFFLKGKAHQTWVLKR